MEPGLQSVQQRSNAKKQNEPGTLDARLALEHDRSRHGQRDNPKRTGELDGGADSQRRWPVFRGGADHRTSVVNRQRRPEPKLALAHMQREANRWKEKQRNRI